MVKTFSPPFSGLKGMGGLARAWVVAVNGDPASLTHDNMHASAGTHQFFIIGRLGSLPILAPKLF